MRDECSDRYDEVRGRCCWDGSWRPSRSLQNDALLRPSATAAETQSFCSTRHESVNINAIFYVIISKLHRTYYCYSAPVRVRCIVTNPSVCPCVCLSVREHISKTAGPILAKFLCTSPVAVVQSSSGGVALCYVLSVLWIASRLVVTGATPKGGGGTQRRRYYVATGAESDVCERLFETVLIASW